MKRQQLVEECCKAVASCWNHYCDNKLSGNDEAVKDLLDQALPAYVSTMEWTEYARQYDRRVAEEDTAAGD